MDVFKMMVEGILDNAELCPVCEIEMETNRLFRGNGKDEGYVGFRSVCPDCGHLIIKIYGEKDSDIDSLISKSGQYEKMFGRWVSGDV